VVRNLTPGMGLQFIKLNTRDRVLLEILMRRRCCERSRNSLLAG
jgi:hypothetical protein